MNNSQVRIWWRRSRNRHSTPLYIVGERDPESTPLFRWTFAIIIVLGLTILAYTGGIFGKVAEKARASVCVRSTS
jgi:hypothetical protein